MATDNSEYSAADARSRRRRTAQFAVLAVVFGVAALPLWHAYQAWSHPALLWLAAAASALTAFFLVFEYAIAAAPQLKSLRALFAWR